MGNQPISRSFEEKAIEGLKNIVLRVLAAVAKIISVHGMILGLATWLAYEGKLAWYAWLLCAGSVMGYRYFTGMLGGKKE